MIRLTPPTSGLIPPPRPDPQHGLRPVLPVGEAMSICEAGGSVRIDFNDVHSFPGNRVVVLLTPEDAARLALEAGTLARKLGA